MNNIWLVTAGEPLFYSTLEGAIKQLNYLHHSMADTFPRDMTDPETGFREFNWELTDIDTQEDTSKDPWATDVWASYGYWYNHYTDETRQTIISLIKVPFDTQFGESKYDHEERELLLNEDHR